MDLPDLNDNKTILAFIKAIGIKDNRGSGLTRDKEFQTKLNNFYINEFQHLVNNKLDLRRKGQVLEFIAIQIKTCLNNNIKEHFITRIRNFINNFPPNIDLTIKENYKLFSKMKNNILFDKIKEIPTEYLQWANNIRDNFLPKEYLNNFKYDCKVNPTKYIKYTIKMNKETEKYNNEINNSNLSEEDKRKKIKKLFQPFSLRTNIIPKYITIDSKVILQTIPELKISEFKGKITEKREEIWSNLFNMKSKLFKKNNFEVKSIQTDGIGVTLYFQKLGRASKQKTLTPEDNSVYIEDLTDEELNKCKNMKLIGGDPNKHSLIYLIDEDNKKLRYTNTQRAQESQRKKYNKIILKEKKTNNIIEEETKISIYNSKTVDFQKFKEYIRNKNEFNEKVKSFYEDIKFRKFKWRICISSRKSEDKFISRIEETYGKNIIIGYGDWSENKQMKSVMPSKGIGLRRLISKKYKTPLINEFRTSKLCNKCNKELTNYNKLHRVLICKSEECNSSESKKEITFINRDINASLNILNLLKEWVTTKRRNPLYKIPDLDICKRMKTLNQYSFVVC